MQFPELHRKKIIVVFRSKRDTVYYVIEAAEQISESRKDLRGRQKSRRPCYVVFNEVREIAFTPPPPSDRVHEPLISSFALIKILNSHVIHLFNAISFSIQQNERKRSRGSISPSSLILSLSPSSLVLSLSLPPLIIINGSCSTSRGPPSSFRPRPQNDH